MIHIPDPCNEDFSKMTATERGAFCQKCSIDTFDFRHMSTEQINHVLLKHKGEHVCGRISTQQLEALNAGFLNWKNQSKKTFQSKFIMALVMVFGLTLFACQDEEKETIQELNKIELTSDDGQIAYINQEHDLSELDLLNYLTPEYEVPELIEPIECFIESGEIVYEEDVVQDVRYYETAGMIAGGLSYTDYTYLEYVEDTTTTDSSESILAEPILTNPDYFEAKAFPNPTQAFSTIAIEVETEGQFDITVYNMNGQLIQSIHSGELYAGRHQFELDLSSVESGMYLINIISKDQQEVLKVQKLNQ